jgi:hypothetical protein
MLSTCRVSPGESVLGADRHFDADHAAAIVHRPVVENVLDQVRPRVIWFCCKRGQRAEQEQASEADQAEKRIGHAPPS